jgi:excisionase family DNA binding protein
MYDPAGPPGRDAGTPAPLLHTAAEAAALLRVSKWWLTDRARRRLIPFVFIGGQYRFTDAQLGQIVAVHSYEAPETAAVVSAPPRLDAEVPIAVVASLRARSPRRTRSAASRLASAA